MSKIIADEWIEFTRGFGLVILLVLTIPVVIVFGLLYFCSLGHLNWLDWYVNKLEGIRS